MTERIRNFLDKIPHDGPVLVVDLEAVRENYLTFSRTMPDTSIYYAVKANPAPEILSLLAELGSSFDCASVAEIEMVLAAGATADRISFGNTIKKEADIARAHALGVRLFAFDARAELEKIARAAPGGQVFCRILCDGEGAEWPLSRKFGCDPAMAEGLMEEAQNLGLEPLGLSFHVGSQQTDLAAWDRALATVGGLFRRLADKGIVLRLVNLGGGFPARYRRDVPAMEAYSQAIHDAIIAHFGNHPPKTIIEPGRAMVGNAGIIRSEVVLISRKDQSKTSEDNPRWVFLDIGKFGGLVECMDEAIRYPIRSRRDDDAMEPAIIAGPTCDSADVLYERNRYPLPLSLDIGDHILIEATGAYTSTYASVAFNGFAPLKSLVI
ncbi:type III PLP-dependent enzyme [Aestuariispira ectoiniformans]|uniref:type III PLP-dependent enzyme n=1 Tax=Aestuariispira ectoiniformans TaxID=2775080 RepID=UPI00223BCE96|nr:type III PLP-dependent enzyme [Aestuariispira ectoiniformans]